MRGRVERWAAFCVIAIAVVVVGDKFGLISWVKGLFNRDGGK